jgi:hypothetical protein
MMTDEERTLLLEVAKYCYVTGMDKLISCHPIAEAIRKFEPDFESRLESKTPSSASLRTLYGRTLYGHR